MNKDVYYKIKRSDGQEFFINVGENPDWKIPSKGTSGFGDYSNDLAKEDNGVGDGGIITGSRVGIKDRTIVAVSRNPNKNDILRRAALSFFSPKYNYEVYFTYMGITRWFEGKIHKFDLPSRNINKKMELKVTFMCPNPFLKSYDNFGKNIAAVTGRMAFPYVSVRDSRYPQIVQGITAGIFNFAQEVELDNDGDVDAFSRCIIEATGTVTNPKLIINGGYVRILDVMTHDDVIEIDFTKSPPTVKKNGVNCIGKCDRTSSFDDMALVVGTSKIGYDADNGSDLMNVTVYYNKLYATI